MAHSSGMHIEVFDQPQGLHGDPEVWIKVLSNTVVDLPDVLEALNDQQRELLKPTARRPIDYHPHLVTPEEKAEHGYLWEDWWIYAAPPRPVPPVPTEEVEE